MAQRSPTVAHAARGAPAGALASGMTLDRYVGRSLKQARSLQRLTISEVATEAGISSGMLSKIENGQTTSLDTLARLCDALGMTIAALFQGFNTPEGGAQHVPKGEGLEVVRRGTRRGHTYHLLASERGPQRTFEPYLVTLTDRSEVFPSFEHPGIEFLYLLEGKIRYRHGKQTYLLSAGDSLTFRGEVPHGPETLIRTPIRMLSVIVYAEAPTLT